MESGPVRDAFRRSALYGLAGGAVLALLGATGTQQRWLALVAAALLAAATIPAVQLTRPHRSASWPRWISAAAVFLLVQWSCPSSWSDITRTVLLPLSGMCALAGIALSAQWFLVSSASQRS